MKIRAEMQIGCIVTMPKLKWLGNFRTVTKLNFFKIHLPVLELSRVHGRTEGQNDSERQECGTRFNYLLSIFLACNGSVKKHS